MGNDADLIVANAKGAAGLDQFDSDSFREGLDRIADYVGRSPTLTDNGRTALRGLSAALLANRLRIAHFARENPVVSAREVHRPIVIFGMPRTGTTMVSHLLSLDARRRSLLRWEVFDSAPPPAAGALHSDPRCLRMKEADELVLNTPPEIHLEQADLPIECIVSFAHDFKGMLWAGIIDDAAFMDWTLGGDMTSAFAFHKLQLQLLQAHTSNDWVFKAPAYGLHLKELRAFHPDARLVWTHRDPYRAMASICSITAAQRRSFMDVDEQALGPSLIEAFHAHVARPLAARDGGAHIYDLHYGRLMRDPMAEMERLYDWLGESFPADVQAEMERWIAANPRGRFGKHGYGLERFGLSVDRLRPYFEDYADRCAVEEESFAAS